MLTLIELALAAEEKSNLVEWHVGLKIERMNER